MSAYLNKKQDVNLEKYKVDGQIDMKLVEAEVAVVQARAATLSHLSVAHYLFIVPTAAYYAAIVLDCITEALFKWRWDVQPMGGWAGVTANMVVGFLFLNSALKAYKR